MKILVACEESQAVTIELRKLGHDAYSCDIEPCSGGHPEWHIRKDVLKIINGKTEFFTDDYIMHAIFTQWDMIIAFPPCTYLSNAGACRLYPRKGELNLERYEKGLAARKFFMSILFANCERIAVENPVSSKIYEMPTHTQEIQPWQFGHPYTKKTRLWLRGLPLLVPTEIMQERQPFIPAGTGRKDKSKYGAKGCAHESKPRSKTFSGIAKAIANQWAGECND